MAVKNLKSFQSAVSKFSRTLEPSLVVPFYKKIALELFSRIILKTPVDTGRARGNWQITINTSPEGTVDRKFGKPRKEKLDKAPPLNVGGGTAAVSRADKQLNTIRKVNSKIFITNNLPYITVLEAGRRGKKGSVQASNGMVNVALAEVRMLFP